MKLKEEKKKNQTCFKTFLNKHERLLLQVTYLASLYLQTYMQSYYLDLQSTLILIFFQNLSSSSSLSCIIHWTSNPMWHWGFHILCSVCERYFSHSDTQGRCFSEHSSNCRTAHTEKICCAYFTNPRHNVKAITIKYYLLGERKNNTLSQGNYFFHKIEV